MFDLNVIGNQRNAFISCLLHGWQNGFTVERNDQQYIGTLRDEGLHISQLFSG